MKDFGYTLSILNNTNRAVGHSNVDWSFLRPDSFCVIENDNDFYTVKKTNKFNFNKIFQVIESKRILIFEDIQPILQKGDNLQIDFSVYELHGNPVIKRCGRNYKDGEIITIENGIPYTQNFDNKPQNALLQVIKTNSIGEIVEIKLANGGKYLIPPDKTIQLKDDLEIEIENKLSNIRPIIERTIQKIDHEKDKTHVWLNNDLPAGLSDAKLSVKKWELFLDRNYMGETKWAVGYKILTDVSPHLHIPLMVKNTIAFESIFNNAILRLEQEIKQLKESQK